MTTIGGRYELAQRLGEGTFGEVWAAHDTRFDARLVAIKILKAEFLSNDDKSLVDQVLARFRREAEALVRIDHPNVVAATDRGEWEGRPYLVMEHVDGQTLEDWLFARWDAGKQVGLEEVREIFAQVCLGVAAAHQVKQPGPIVHRDLKPGNVMLRQDASGKLVAKVVDFGVARLGQGMGTIGPLGTEPYMPPEQGVGAAKLVCPASDVFALGVMLIEMLTAKAQPTPGQCWWHFVMRSEDQVRPWLDQQGVEVPPAVWDVAEQCLRRDVAERFQNAAALRTALERAWETPNPELLATVPTMLSVELGWHGQPMPEGLHRGVEHDTYVWRGERSLDIAMVYIPPGEFWRGSDDAEDSAMPRHACRMTEGYYIARYPTTVGQYRLFLAAEHRPWKPPPFAHEDSHPVVNVTWKDVRAFCQWAGLRLPSESEWEYAARGHDGPTYPWGDHPPTDDDLWWSGATRRSGTCPVGTHPKGSSPFGVEDMAGNAWEWTSDWYGPYPTAPKKVLIDPKGAGDGTVRVIRGGGWSNNVASVVRSACRNRFVPTIRNEYVGFRCVRGRR